MAMAKLLNPLLSGGSVMSAVRSTEQMLMNWRFVMMLRSRIAVLYLIAGLSLAVMLFTWHATDPGWCIIQDPVKFKMLLVPLALIFQAFYCIYSVFRLGGSCCFVCSVYT
ncbi:hypothetical protein OURE66S_01541 [Oligella ureolytica]